MTKLFTSKRSVSGTAQIGIVPFSKIEEAFDLGPVEVQRDHAKRAAKVTHIGKFLSAMQMLFIAVWWKGQIRLLDGYTRVERIRIGLTERPDAVNLLVLDEPGSLEELIALYDQIDSTSSSKKASDRFDEGLRLTELMGNLKSQLCLRGPKTAPKLACNSKTNRDGVRAAHPGMRFVDGLGLDKTHEGLGMLAAYYAVGLFGDKFAETAELFIRKMNQRVFEPRKPTQGDKAILAFRLFHTAKQEAGSLGGGTNAAIVRNRALYTFLVYGGLMSYLSAEVTEATLTLGDFKSVMDKAVKAA